MSENSHKHKNLVTRMYYVHSSKTALNDLKFNHEQLKSLFDR